MYQSSSNIIFITFFLSMNNKIIMHCSDKMLCSQFLNAIQLCYIYLDWQSRKWLISQLLLRWIKTIDMSHFVSLHLNPLLTGTEHSVKMVQYLSTESIWHTPVTVTHWPSLTLRHWSLWSVTGSTFLTLHLRHRLFCTCVWLMTDFWTDFVLVFWSVLGVRFIVGPKLC